MLAARVSRKACPWLKAWRANSKARTAGVFAHGSRTSAAVAAAPGIDISWTNNFKNHVFTNGTEQFDVYGRIISDCISHSTTWAECNLPTEFGDFKMRSYPTGEIVMHVGGCAGHNGFAAVNEKVLVRIHSECVTSEIFGSVRCDCAHQLREAMKIMAEKGKGVLIYLKQEGRGLGLHNKIKAYELQETGLDTVQANLELGHAVDYRQYDAAGMILRDLNIKDVTLLSNNPDKIEFIRDMYPNANTQPIHPCPDVVAKFPWMQKYLKTKKEKCGHKLDKF